MYSTGKNQVERDLGFEVARVLVHPFQSRHQGISHLKRQTQSNWNGKELSKNIVYAEKIRNMQHLQERITSATETVTWDMIQKTWQETEFRLDVSRATNGAHIEMY